MRVDSKEATNSDKMSRQKLPKSIELAANLPESRDTDNAVQINYELNHTNEAGDSGEDSPTKSLKCLAAEYSEQQENYI